VEIDAAPSSLSGLLLAAKASSNRGRLANRLTDRARNLSRNGTLVAHILSVSGALDGKR